MPHEILLFSLLEKIQNTKKMNTRESKERKFLKNKRNRVSCFNIYKYTQFFFISNQPSDSKLLSNFQGSTLFHGVTIRPTDKEKWSFFFAINVKQLLNRQYTKILKSITGKIFKSVMINIDFETCKLLHSSQTQITWSNP